MGLRHQMLTDTAIHAGLDTAKELAAHDPGTKTLQRHYLHVLESTDLSAIALGEKTGPRGQSEDMMRKNHKNVLFRLKPDEIARTNGPMLEAYVKKLAAADPEFPTQPGKERKNWLRCARRQARTILQAEEAELLRNDLGQDEYEQRLAGLNDTPGFVKALVTKGLKAMRAASSQMVADASTTADDDLDGNDSDFSAQEDLEDQY